MRMVRNCGTDVCLDLGICDILAGKFFIYDVISVRYPFSVTLHRVQVSVI